MASLNYNDVKNLEFAVSINWNLNLDVSLNSEWQSIMTKYNVTGGVTGDLNARCVSAAVPEVESTTVNAMVRGFKLNQHVAQEGGGTQQLVFMESSDWALGKVFQEIRDLSWNRQNGKTSLRSRYMLSEGFDLELLDHDKLVKSTYNMQNVAINSCTATELEGETGTLVQWTVVFAWENFFIS